MFSKKNQLPKHIALMVEKNNLVMAIKTLAAEQNITLDEAKTLIDDYEAQLKANHAQNAEKIANKQGTHPHNSQPTDATTPFSEVNAGLDHHLSEMGYQKPFLPYWVKRLLVILIITCLLGFLFWQAVF